MTALGKLLRTTAFKLSLVYLTVFALFAVFLLAYFAWNADRLVPRHPIAASFTTVDTDLPRIRFLMDPEIPVIRGTRRIR